MTYRMEDATFDHLREYIRRYGPSDVNALDEADRILTYLMSLDAGDAEYYVREGWGQCIDAANVADSARD